MTSTISAIESSSKVKRNQAERDTTHGLDSSSQHSKSEDLVALVDSKKAEYLALFDGQLPPTAHPHYNAANRPGFILAISPMGRIVRRLTPSTIDLVSDRIMQDEVQG